MKLGISNRCYSYVRHAIVGPGAEGKYGGQGPCAAEVAQFCSHVATDLRLANACLKSRDQLSRLCALYES
jgi:hypothetical protein